MESSIGFGNLVILPLFFERTRKGWFHMEPRRQSDYVLIFEKNEKFRNMKEKNCLRLTALAMVAK